MPLSVEIRSALEILRRGSECIDAVQSMNREENRFTRALEDLQRLATDEHISLAIVGGLGAIHFGYPAATQDIDIAIDRQNLQALMESSARYGLKIVWESKLGWHTLTHDDVEINIVPEGGKSRDTSPTVIPGPRQMGLDEGLHYAPIEYWMELKISSGRQKDRAHVVEVLKLSNPTTVERIRSYLTTVHEQYEQTFLELLTEAEAERQQEKGRR